MNQNLKNIIEGAEQHLKKRIAQGIASGEMDIAKSIKIMDRFGHIENQLKAADRRTPDRIPTDDEVTQATRER